MLPKVAPPVISIPKVALPTVKIPDIPKVTLPTLPKVVLPSLPAVKLPDLSGAVVGLPAAVMGAGAVTTAAVVSGKLPDLPKLPDIGGAVGAVGNTLGGAAGAIGGALPALPKLPDNPELKTVSGAADALIGARDKSYEDGLTRAFAGRNTAETALGVAQVGGTMAADAVLPMDLINVVNKTATGRGGDLTGEDYFWAAVDAGTLALGVATGGIGYGVARGLIKGGKLGSKGLKVGGDMLKLGNVRKVAGAIGGKFGSVKKPAWVQELRKAPAPKKAPAPAPRKNTVSWRETYTKKAPVPETPRYKTPAPESGMMKIADTEAPKMPDIPKAQSKVKTLGTAALVGVTGAGLGTMALNALGAFGAPPGEDGGGEYPYDPYAGYNPYGTAPGAADYPGEYEYPGGWWGADPTGGESPYDPYYPGEDGNGDGYYDPGYPGGEYFVPVENFAQDVGGFLEGLPVVGGLFAEAARRGLAFPLLLGCCIVIAGGGYYVATKTKAGRSAIRTVKGVVA
ncbi:hypothetical protein ABH15_09995 [Methanoculleus taiwanensis]|uniref:Uncharacterized protein n=2 Tax=Methanoculleus taiwanensis TaxID=1550565 RepID=A0A498H341_9EURY|nr:hypothetical protein ABH15_09995 [Methanoculleus taiwanensis]